MIYYLISYFYLFSYCNLFLGVSIIDLTCWFHSNRCTVQQLFHVESFPTQDRLQHIEELICRVLHTQDLFLTSDLARSIFLRDQWHVFVSNYLGLAKIFDKVLDLVGRIVTSKSSTTSLLIDSTLVLTPSLLTSMITCWNLLYEFLSTSLEICPRFLFSVESLITCFGRESGISLSHTLLGVSLSFHSHDVICGDDDEREIELLIPPLEATTRRFTFLFWALSDLLQHLFLESNSNSISLFEDSLGCQERFVLERCRTLPLSIYSVSRVSETMLDYSVLFDYFCQTISSRYLTDCLFFQTSSGVLSTPVSKLLPVSVRQNIANISLDENDSSSINISRSYSSDYFFPVTPPMILRKMISCVIVPCPLRRHLVSSKSALILSLSPEFRKASFREYGSSYKALYFSFIFSLFRDSPSSTSLWKNIEMNHTVEVSFFQGFLVEIPCSFLCL